MEVINRQFISRIFPPSRKAARLALIEKPKLKEGNKETSYGPVCTINAITKLYKCLLANRIVKEMTEEQRNLNEGQFGVWKTPWRGIIEAMTKREISTYQVKPVAAQEYK